MASGRRGRRFLLILTAFCVASSPRATLAQTQQAPVTGSPATPRRLTTFEPLNPYRLLTAGLLVRTRFVADRSALHAVEIWDVMVGPARRSEKARLPGAAILEVRSGTGVLSSGGEPRTLRAGAVVSVDEATEFTLANGDKESPLILRATIVRGRQR